jgi:hypothetical protein
VSTREELHRPFRPVRSRRVARVTAVVQFVVLLGLALALPSGEVQWYDRVGIVLVGAAIGWWLSRYVLISAVPSEQGLRVRNLMLSRTLAWPDVYAVRMGGGAPWLTLELQDGDTLAVMAVQRSDGDRARREADRLATLVALHARGPAADPHAPGGSGAGD